MEALFKPHKAVIVNKQREYLIHEDGTVTKFLFGVDEVSSRNLCYVVGKLKKRVFPNKFDHSFYDRNGLSPLVCAVEQTDQDGLYRLSV